MKMAMSHDTSRRAKKARLLVLSERSFMLGPNNK